MSKRRQKGTRHHRCLNLFEKRLLSADVGFTLVKGSTWKIEGPKTKKNPPTNKTHVRNWDAKNIKKLNKRDHKLDPKGSSKLEIDIKETVPRISEKLNILTRRKLDGGERFCPKAWGNLGPNISALGPKAPRAC